MTPPFLTTETTEDKLVKSSVFFKAVIVVLQGKNVKLYFIDMEKKITGIYEANPTNPIVNCP